MGRKKLEGARTVTIAAKVAPDMADAVDAARGDRTRSAWLADVIALAVGTGTRSFDRDAVLQRTGVAELAVPDVAAPRDESARTVAVPRSAVCAHPPDKLVRRTYGTWCACGARVR